MRRYFDLAKVPKTPILPFVDSLVAAGELPRAVDFHDAFGPVRDQGQEGSCTGFSLAGMLQGLRGVAGLPFVEMSPKFIYTLELQKEGHAGEDVGAIPSDGLAIMHAIGVDAESEDPYVVGDLRPPTPEQVKEAAAHRIGSWQPVARISRPRGQERAAILPVLQLLAQRIPIEIAVEVHRSFEWAQHGRVPQPGPPGDDPELGGHAIVLCGYEDSPAAGPGDAAGGGWVLFRNSWGTGWGDKGHGTLPYSFLASPVWTPGLWSAQLPSDPGPQPFPKGDTAVRVRGRVVTFGKPYEAGVLWAPLGPVIKAMGWTLRPVRTPPGPEVVVTRSARICRRSP